MKKKYWLAACCLLAVGLTACGDDDEGNDNGGPDTTIPGTGDPDSPGTGTGDSDTDVPGTGEPGITVPSTSDLGIQYPVTSITGYEESYFRYENGRLVGGMTDNDQFTIAQNPLAVQMRWESSYEIIDESYTNIKVNPAGFATSADFTQGETYMDGEYSDSYVYSGTARMQYDADGHITQKRISIGEEGGYQYDGTITYTWENGNLVRIQVDDTEKDYDGIYVYSDTYEYTYADVSQNVNSGIYLYDMWYFTYDFMWYAGFFGKPTQNLPIGMKYTYNYRFNDGEVETDTEIYDIVTRYNDNGSVARMEYRQEGSSSSSMTFNYGYGETEPFASLAPSLQKNAKGKGLRRGPAFRHRR